MPFNQAAGHTYAYDWERGKWFGNEKRISDFRKLTKLNPESRLSLTVLGDSLLVGADPGFEKREPSIDAQPVVLIGETDQE